MPICGALTHFPGARSSAGGDQSPVVRPDIMDLRDIHTPVLLERCIELLTPALGGENPVVV
ncbi:MAG TPA: hypothetical protein DGU37_12305, partial [Microbacterium sp.]|nr:hypothetical protein [Microbacterium sp.]